jgi:hypothetical protein
MLADKSVCPLSRGTEFGYAPSHMVRAVIVSFGLACLGAGCSRESASEAAVADVRGQPIVAANISKGATTASNESPSLRRGLQGSEGQSQASEGQGEGYVNVGFDKLSSYAFELSDDLLAPATNSVAATERVEAQIPKPIKALDQKPVVLSGFMLPLKVEGGLVTEMLIMKDQSMCCYGVQPKINEWVSVRMVKTGVKPIMDQPVKLYGKLRVGEMRENGYLVGIYALEGEKMQVPN